MTYARRPITWPEARQMATDARLRAERLIRKATLADPDTHPADHDPKRAVTDPSSSQQTSAPKTVGADL